MVSVDLKDAYLQVPIHPSSCRFLRFVAGGRTFQFRVLCFGLTMAPQVFTRVMALVSAFLHRLGVRILRYLDDWPILASREGAIRARDQVLELCQTLGTVVNLEKSSLSPAQSVDYLGVRIGSQTFRASPTPLRTEKFFSIVEEFLSSREQSAKSWRVLLDHLASLIHLVPGSRLHLRSLQLALRSGWDFVDESVLVAWYDSCQANLLWWYDEDRLTDGVFLDSHLPELMFWSDASDQVWGATMSDHFHSGLWSEEEARLSISVRELLAVEKGLRAFLPLLRGYSVAVFCDNTTAISYLRHQGGTLSPTLNPIAQRLLRWVEAQEILLFPQFVMGKHNVVADALSHPNQVLGLEWTLHQEVFNSLRKRRPVMVDLFATSLNHRMSVYFAPMSDPMAAATDAMLQAWDHLQAYAFPPVAMIRAVLNKIRSSLRVEITLIAPFWPVREWFPGLLSLLSEPPIPLPLQWDLLRQPHVRKFHQRLSTLRLHAWRLSSDTQEPQGSLLEWLNNLAVPEDPPC